ncbi:MAG TPA: hypothetical protein VD905_06585 [Flavobacteriales bacterium]|nr:hypothetical protein [Flavobacteriales bacterium]
MNNINKILGALLIFTLTTYACNRQEKSSTNHGDNKEAVDYDSKNYGDNNVAGKYKKINGINLYYEIYGTGKPLIFLHGNGGSIEAASARIDYFEKIL